MKLLIALMMKSNDISQAETNVSVKKEWRVAGQTIHKGELLTVHKN
ncbi:hypothetical protein [uncultured Vagococcus sp.]|nr:hypothetical protein [uncultured Vagococcus sp.]